MSAAQEHLYLQAVPPPQDTSWRMALLLPARHLARQAWDAARSVPAAAAEFVRRLLGAEQLRAPLAWLRQVSGRLGQLVRPVMSRLDVDGVVTAVGLALSSSTVRSLLYRLGRAALSTSVRVPSTVGRLLDGALRLCGAPGNRADVLSTWAGKARKSASECAAPLLSLLVRANVATEGLRAVIGGVLRGYALHKVLRLLITNPVLRAFVAAAVVPAFADGRLLTQLRDLAEQVQWRLWRLQRRVEQARQELAEPGGEEPAAAQRQHSAAPDGDASVPPPGPVVESHQPAHFEPPQPTNRAERRAQQQREARQRRKPQFA